MTLRTIIAIALVFVLVRPPNVSAQPDVTADTLKTQISTAIKVLNPVAATLSGLIDYAISKADDALKARLDQANAIVQEAIASLNDVLKNRINQIDTYTREQRVEAFKEVELLLNKVNTNITQYLGNVDQITFERINQAQSSMGNLLASLPIPTEPLVISKPEGFTVFRSKGPTTLLTLAGSGLFKDNTEPVVKIYRADLNPITAFPVKVIARSMQYTQLAIPNDRIVEDVRYVILLKYRKGNQYFVLPEYSAPSFQLFVCKRPPTYGVKVRMEATGNIWETRVVQHPDVPVPFQLNCSPGQSLNQDFTPRAHAGWELDTSYGHEGMDATIGANDGRGEHSFAFTGNKFTMHCKGTNGEGGYQRVDTLLVGEKRAKPNSACGTPLTAAGELKYGVANEFQLNRTSLLQGCVDPNLHKTPDVLVTVELVLNGKTVEATHITDHGSGPMFDGKLLYDLDQHGLLKLRMGLFCSMQ